MNDFTSSSNCVQQQRCPSHPMNDIIYYCQSVHCEKTLCFECLKEHSNIHKSNKTSQHLVTLSQMKKECQEKVGTQLQILLDEIKSIENHYLYNYESLLKSHLDNLFQARLNTEMLIKNFFDNIEFKIRNTLLEIYEKNYPFILKSLEDFKRFIGKLNEYKCRLEGEVNLNYLLSLNFQSLFGEYDKIKKESYTQLETLSRKTLVIKDEVFTKLTNILTQEIRYEPISDISFIQEQTLYYSEIKLKQMNTQTVPGDEVKITSPNYFSDDCKHKILHFFQDSTKLLRIIDVESLYNSLSKSYHIFEIPLNITFDIPAWHKSVITSKGDIFLVGGINVHEENKELKSIYKFDYDELTLEEYPPMMKERYGHELCYINENIFIIGGSNDAEGMLVFCEKYDLTEKKSSAIASLKVKTCCGCSCLYRQQFIYLFGGLLEDKILNDCIQCYDINNDLWEVIKFELDKDEPPQILWCSSSVQINNNQIMVFGGYLAENEGCRSSFLLDIDGRDGKENKNKDENNVVKHRILRNNTFDLPYGEGFWNNQSIIQKGNIFCLQNIQNEEDGTQLNLRRVMSFTGKKWTIFEKKS